MSAVRVGIIGLGNIGQQHAKLLSGGAIDGAELSAVGGRGGDLGAPFGVPCFPDHQALIHSGLVDAVLIATPTQSHPEIGQAALKQGLHVLMEKPLAMSIGEAQGLISAAPEQSRFAVMLNQRFHPAYARIKTLLDEGRLGPLQRFAWTMTGWYRPDVYYKVSKWRGTWPGEGGGLLINQCIHNLDVLQWLVGMPSEVFAVAGFGRYHEIDVEDEVTATLGFGNGLTGTVTASSGEAPGINQLDLVGDLGTLRFDGDRIRLYASAQSVADHCANTLDMFGMPEFTEHPIAAGGARGPAWGRAAKLRACHCPGRAAGHAGGRRAALDRTGQRHAAVGLARPGRCPALGRGCLRVGLATEDRRDQPAATGCD